MRTHYIYILRCADGTLYTGYTTDVERRVAEHNAGEAVAAKYTRSRRPVTLVYHEVCASRAAALRREYEIKQLSRTQKQSMVDNC